MNSMETFFNNPRSYILGIFEVEKISFTAGSKNEINLDVIWRLCTVREKVRGERKYLNDEEGN